jgi:quinol monooxygenase YgiN
MTFVLAVKITVKEGEDPEVVLPWLKEMMDRSNEEPGCRSMVLHREISDPRVFFVYEHFDDKAAHTLHTQTEHFKNIAEAKVTPLVDFDMQELELYESDATAPVA